MLIRNEDILPNKVLIMKLNCVCERGRSRSAWECQVGNMSYKKEGREWEEIRGEVPWEDG